MKTNLTKTEIFPIRCDEDQIAAAIQIFPAKRGSFPCTYLGLPLHFTRLKDASFQPLIDKIGARLAGWKGKHFTRAGRVVLARSVLSSMVTYYLTIFILPKWVLRRIDKIRRNFIWMKGTADPGMTSHPLVNWPTVCRPVPLGGLGVMDLERFGRVLRLRWPWLAWTDASRPWLGARLPCSGADMELFRASTKISLGDGDKCLFWHDSWLPDGPLKLRFPNLFSIATRKNMTVKKEFQNANWIQALQNIATAPDLSSFVELWELLRDVHLLPRPDTIVWKWTASGAYSAASAYRCQFLGSHAPFDTKKIWRAHAEPKCRFFAWLVAHKKIRTADVLALRGWPHDPICKLCHIHQETVQHLCHDCTFTAEVRDSVLASSDLPVPPAATTMSRDFDGWWLDYIATFPKEKKRAASGVIAYIIWGVWKERNGRVFTNVALPLLDVARMVCTEIEQRALAFTDDPGDHAA